MNPIRSFEAAIDKVWKSEVPAEVKVANLRKVEDSIKHYLDRADIRTNVSADPLALCARKRALGYLELLRQDCTFLANRCGAKGAPKTATVGGLAHER